VLAWDAPGYGQSEPLPDSQPTPQAYAQRLWAWLDALGLQ
jgi:pimeloyl-ACP methyl ester carboxylesterase